MTGERGQFADEPARTADEACDEDTPGDPACWLRRVCPACGTLANADPPTSCPRCHAAISGPDG